jgi:hypothetical protein
LILFIPSIAPVAEKLQQAPEKQKTHNYLQTGAISDRKSVVNWYLQQKETKPFLFEAVRMGNPTFQS